MSKADLYFYTELLKISIAYAEKFLIIISMKQKNILKKSTSYSHIEITNNKPLNNETIKKCFSTENIKKMTML